MRPDWMTHPTWIGWYVCQSDMWTSDDLHIDDDGNYAYFMYEYGMDNIICDVGHIYAGPYTR